MTRVKSSRVKKARHKKILRSARGFRGARSKLVRTAKEALMHSGEYAYSGRKQRKRVKRSEWILTISSALGKHNISYNKFVKALKEKDVLINRKILAEIIMRDTETFDKIVTLVK
jgi:large subunit ribosomal protein L20